LTEFSHLNKVGRALRHLEMAEIDEFSFRVYFSVIPGKRIRG
jgi:hypothetical protein